MQKIEKSYRHDQINKIKNKKDLIRFMLKYIDKNDDNYALIIKKMRHVKSKRNAKKRNLYKKPENIAPHIWSAGETAWFRTCDYDDNDKCIYHDKAFEIIEVKHGNEYLESLSLAYGLARDKKLGGISEMTFEGFGTSSDDLTNRERIQKQNRDNKIITKDDLINFMLAHVVGEVEGEIAIDRMIQFRIRFQDII